MKDLSSPQTFADEKYDFDKYIKERVITSDEISSKSEEIDEWEAEQKQDKTAISMDISDYQNPQDMMQQQNIDNFGNSFNNQNDYDNLVNSIRKSLSPHRKAKNNNSQFGLNNNFNMNENVENVSSFMYWFKFGLWGKDLTEFESELELKDKDDQQNNFNFFGNQQKDTKEKPEIKELRTNIENWAPLLFVGKVNALIATLSLVLICLKSTPLFINPLYLLIVSGTCLLLTINKLNKDFHDGPLNNNFTFSDININKQIETTKQQLQQKENQSHAEKPKHNSMFGSDHMANPKSRSMSFDDFNFDDDNEDTNDDFNFDDDLDDDLNDSPEIQDQAASHIKTNNHLSSKHVGQEADDSNGFPKAWGSAENEQELFQAEEKFLKYVWKNRFDIDLHKPIDILNFFAPIIVSYNKKFAKVEEVDRNEWLFKNIAYALGKYYNEIDNKFSKYNKHQKEFYYAVDELVQTDLYYKVKITLPLSINVDRFQSNITKFENILRKNPDDNSVSIILEMSGRTGYIKFMRINDAGFLPLVSTGDVLRFKGMKTFQNKDLIEELSSPGDMKVFFGLKNAEKAMVLDIAAEQNTNIVVCGFTGSGKTVSTTAWLANLLVTHSPEEVGFIILDPKNGSAWQAFRYAPHVLGYFRQQDLNKWPGITEMLRDIETARQDYMNNTIRKENYYEARKAFAKDEDWERLMTVPRLFVIYDEMLDTISGLKNLDSRMKAENKGLKRDDKKFETYYDTFDASLGGLANVTREGGMTLMVLSQRSDNNAIPRKYLSSASVQFVMKVKFQNDAARIFGVKNDNDIPDMTNLPTGSGYIKDNSLLSPQQLQTPLFSGNPKFNNEVIKCIGLAWTMIYSAHHDQRKLPQGFFIEKAHIKSAYGINDFSLFNRNIMYEKIKKELLEGDVHYELRQTDLSFDLTENEKYLERKNNKSIFSGPSRPLQKVTTNNYTRTVSQDQQQEIPVSQDQYDMPVSQDQQEIPISQDQQEMPVSQDQQGIPVSQDQYDMPVSQDQQEIPISQDQQEMPVSQDQQGIPISQDQQETPIGQDQQEMPVSQDQQKEKATYSQASHKTKMVAPIMNKPQLNKVKENNISSESLFSNIGSNNIVKPIINNNINVGNKSVEYNVENYKVIQSFFIQNHIKEIDCDQLEQQFNKNIIEAALRKNIIRKTITNKYIFL